MELSLQYHQVPIRNIFLWMGKIIDNYVNLVVKKAAPNYFVIEVVMLGKFYHRQTNVCCIILLYMTKKFYTTHP